MEHSEELIGKSSQSQSHVVDTRATISKMITEIDAEYAEKKAVISDQADLIERYKTDHVERGRGFQNYAGRIDEVIDSTKKHIKKITNEFTDEEA